VIMVECRGFMYEYLGGSRLFEGVGVSLEDVWKGDEFSAVGKGETGLMGEYVHGEFMTVK